MKLEKLKIQQTKGIMLTPFMDVLTVLLIYLIVCFSPAESEIKVSQTIKLPETLHHLRNVPHIQIEVAGDHISIAGKTLDGIVPEKEQWANFSTYAKTHLSDSAKAGKSGDPILLVADKSTSYRFIERTVAHLAAAGFSDIYFLSEMKETN